MIGFIDKKIGNFLLRILHNRREKVIAKTLIEYRASRGADEQTLAALREKLEYEMTRVYAIADESIVRERIQRARYTFWISAAIGTGVILAFATFPVTTSLAPFFSPLIGAFTAWAITIGTIPIGYNTRVQGAMDSAIAMFDLEQAQKPAPVDTLEYKVNELQAEARFMRAQCSHTQAANPPAKSSWTTSFWHRRANSAPELGAAVPPSSFRP